MSGAAAQGDFQAWLARTLARAVDGRKLLGAAFCVRHRGHVYGAAAGDLALDTPFFIASTTKLFTTALVMQLRQAGALTLDSPIAPFLNGDVLDSLHLLRGRSHAEQITLRHLLSHTSGLPDYFEGRGADGVRWHQRLLAGEDFGWTPQQAIARSKQMTPAFAPGTPGQALYSDTNFQLLGLVIERLAAQSLAQCMAAHIAQPLGLHHTYLYTDLADTRPRDICHRGQRLHIPQAMASFGADGGMVSTAHEMLRFIDAFFSGALFPRAMLNDLQHWNPIFSPFQAGVGLQRLRLPWAFDPLRRMPPMLGHSGLSGTLAWHCPPQDVSIVGTVNQVAWPGTSLRLAIRMLNKVTQT